MLRVLAKNEMGIVEGDLVELTDCEVGPLPDARLVSVRHLGTVTPADQSLVQSLDLHQSLKSHSGGRLTNAYELVLDREVELAKGL